MSCQQLGDECKLCIFCAPGSEVLFQICLSLSPPPLTPWNVGKNGRGLEKSYIPLYIGRPCCYINYKCIKFKWLIVPKLLASYIQYKYTFLKMYIHQPCARRAHRNRSTYIHPPSVGMIYPISTYIFKWHILPKFLATYIQSKYIFLKMYIPQTCTRRAHRNPPTHIHPPSVGMLYPISTYRFNWHIFPKMLAGT